MALDGQLAQLEGWSYSLPRWGQTEDGAAEGRVAIGCLGLDMSFLRDPVNTPVAM